MVQITIVVTQIVLFFIRHSEGVLPQSSSEGLLRPYRSYADVTLFHYYVPREVSLVTFEFAAFMDSPKCNTRNVYVYLQHGSYPVMSVENATFPPNMYTNRTNIYNIILQSQFEPQNATIFKVYYPQPGSWFAAGFLANWDQHVQQEGLGHKCQYSLGSIGLWTQVSNIKSLPVGSTVKEINADHFTYYRFFVPKGSWSFKLRVDGCKFRTARRPLPLVSPQDNDNLNSTNDTMKIINDMPDFNSSCIQSIVIQAKSLPSYSLEKMVGYSEVPLTDRPDSIFEFEEQFPYTDEYYYILVASETKVVYNITISTEDCPSELLGGRNSIQRYAGLNLHPTSTKSEVLRIKTISNQTSAVTSSTTEHNLKPCKCVPIFRLTRIKHPQDFAESFLLESKEFFTVWLALIDQEPAAVSFELMPFLDIGGTLSIGIHLDNLLLNSTDQTIEVYACIGKSRLPSTLCPKNNKRNSSNCDPGLSLQLNSEGKMDDVVLIPFPEPITYFVSFFASCYVDGLETPCSLPEVLIALDIRTQPCVFSKTVSDRSIVLPCGNYGICQEVHKSQFFFTACRCIGGYRGWGCNDDSEAISQSVLLASTLLLTISNAFFLPAIILAVRRRMFTQAIVYLFTMLSSTLYHACDQDVFSYCLTRYQVLQFCDFFCSILAFWVTLIALAKSSAKYDSALYILGAIVIAIGVEYNRTGLLVFIIPFTLGIAIPVVVWSYRGFRRRKFIKPDFWTFILFVPGVSLGLSGLVLFAFVETEDNYQYVHSAWHVVIALSLLYLLPKNSRKSQIGSSDEHLNPTMEVSNSAELAGVSDPSTSSTEQNPIFFITSELDHLVNDGISIFNKNSSEEANPSSAA